MNATTAATSKGLGAAGQAASKASLLGGSTGGALAQLTKKHSIADSVKAHSAGSMLTGGYNPYNPYEQY
jgi:hypothetical protein